MYIKSKDGKSFKPFEKEDNTNHVEELPAGLYDLRLLKSMFGTTIYLETNEDKESYIEPLGNEAYIRLKKEVDNTCNPLISELYNDMQYINKKGIIVHGKPGTGKTVLVKLIIKAMCEKHNALGIQIHSCDDDAVEILPNLLKSLRKVEKDRTIILFHDECEILLNSPYSQANFVSLLDGMSSIHNFVYLGITNYIERIGDKFKDRPSRIKVWQEIDVVPTEVCKKLLEAKIPEKYKKLIDIPKIAYECEEKKLTIDQIKNHVISKLESIILNEPILEYTSTSHKNDEDDTVVVVN